MTTAYNALVADCLTDCTSEACTTNFAFVETHHDFCLHNQVPTEVEVGFHDLEEVCARQCVIGRLQDPDHSACPAMECPDAAGVEAVIKALADGNCDTTCTSDACATAFKEIRVIHDVCPPVDDKAFEWAGVFAVADASHTWSMQKVADDAGVLAYADPSMKIALIPTDTPTKATMETLENKGSNLLIGTCTVVNDGGSMTPAADGSCFQLTVDDTKDDSTFTIVTSGITGLAVYAEHVPIEFERDTHYLYDSANVDIEPAAQEMPPAFEWAGIFALADATHTWSMQAGTDGTYPDPSMKIVLIPTDTPTAETLEAHEEKGSELLGDENCVVVADGGSMTPVAGGSCFQLTVGTTPDSTFTIVTDGIAGIAVYAEHVPIEFERDTHYLYDSANVDIEPVAEETPAGGHAGHDHGHRRLQDVDAALHTYEDACDAVGCYVEATGCSAGTPDLTALDTLKDRASKGCHITVAEGTTCPSTADAADQSGVQPMTVLAGVALLLTATMN
jgi:hypothetical protein